MAQAESVYSTAFTDAPSATRRKIIATIAAAGGAALPEDPSAPNQRMLSDAELLGMVRKLEEASRIELELAAAANALSERDGRYLLAHRSRVEAYKDALDLFATIENHPAVTMEGLKAKARALDWYHNHFFSQHSRNPQCSLVRDLLAL
jgi:hypothetical protein